MGKTKPRVPDHLRKHEYSPRRLKGWKDEYYIQIYEMAKAGLSNRAIRLSLGVEHETFNRWLNRLPALREGLERARKEVEKVSGVEGFKKFCFGRLPRRLQKYWMKLESFEKEAKETGSMARYRLPKQLGTRARMQIFLYAYMASNFCVTPACQKTGIAVATYQLWMNTEPEFAEILSKMLEAKKDFYESALMDLVKSGDASAIIFANKTLNKDRGYSDKQEIEIQGNISHRVRIEELDLPLEAKLAIRDAMRQKQLALPAPKKDDVQDAEFTIKEKKK